jgi:hypothetical protein
MGVLWYRWWQQPIFARGRVLTEARSGRSRVRQMGAEGEINGRNVRRRCE